MGVLILLIILFTPIILCGYNAEKHKWPTSTEKRLEYIKHEKKMRKLEEENVGKDLKEIWPELEEINDEEDQY